MRKKGPNHNSLLFSLVTRLNLFCEILVLAETQSFGKQGRHHWYQENQAFSKMT